MGDNIDTIRAACIAANPSILNLEFGCKVKWTYEHALNTTARTPITKTGHVILEGHMLGFGRGPLVLLNGNRTPKEIPEKELEILGRSIKLVDVLFAISTHTDEYFTVGKEGELMVNDVEKASWNLLSDSLEAQSEETLAFLASLINSIKKG